MCLNVNSISGITFIQLKINCAFIFYTTIYRKEKESIGFSVCIFALFIIFQSPHNYCSRKCPLSLFVINFPNTLTEHDPRTANAYEKTAEKSGIRRMSTLGR